MEQRKQILALRAFGDFAILLQGLAYARRQHQYHIIASKHLQPLYHAVAPFLPLQESSIAFVDLGIQRSLLRFFTNRYICSTKALQELSKLRSLLKKMPTESYYLEQNNRLNLLELIVQHKLGCISAGKNVYQDYAEFFEAEFPDIPVENNPQRILILPSARLAFRHIPQQSIEQIRARYTGKATFSCGFFANDMGYVTTEDDFIYTSFSELIQHIQKSDVIYCPDSFQAHLCQLLQKPHYIMHPSKVAPAFFTPHVLHYNRSIQF